MLKLTSTEVINYVYLSLAVSGALISLLLKYTRSSKFKVGYFLLGFNLLISGIVLLIVGPFNLLKDLVILIVPFEEYLCLTSGFGKNKLENVKKNFYSSVSFLIIFACVLILSFIPSLFNISFFRFSWIVLGLGLITIKYLILYERKNIKLLKINNIKSYLVDSLAPTLSVVIPARNETDNLNRCLLSLVASDYPKLEILVFDDQSNTSKTADIIKSFAQSGVVFIPGSDPPTGWLAKNWAYQELLNRANGDYLLFCGADTSFEVSSLRELMNISLSNNLSLLSVFPNNLLKKVSIYALFQPIRYAFEIVFPRRFLSHPPALSTCWLVKKDFINKNGQFKSIRNRVAIVDYFARIASPLDQYKFISSQSITSYKDQQSLFETGLRLGFSKLHKRADLVVVYVTVLITLFLLPFVLLIYFMVNFTILAK